MGKGGARHASKPMIDSGLIYSALAPHMDIVGNLGNYEKISKSNGPDYLGLATCVDMWRALLKIEPSGELHPQPMKVALISLLSEHGHLNKANYTGQTWVSLRVERLSTVMTHLRKIKREGTLTAAAARLTREQFNDLQAGLQLMKLRDDGLGKGALEKAPDPSLPLVLAADAEQTGLEKQEGPANKKLEQKDSDVSMNSLGLPAMFDSPEKTSVLEKTGDAMDLEKYGEASSSSRPCLGLVSRKRSGSRVPERQENLQDKLGYTASAASKKPKAKAKTGLEKPVKKSLKKKSKSSEIKAGARKPWVKIHKTMAKSPRRAYLLGSTGLEKPRLIVEVSEKRCPQFEAVIDEIRAAMEKDHLTKAEVLDLREKLCAKHGC